MKKSYALLLALTISLPLLSQSVGLVLSGGGAKGLSHIGVIKALEENNIPIDYVAGTSMGAIVSGLYSIGLTPDEMITLFRSEQFYSWQQGLSEKSFATYIYRREPTPELFGATFNLSRKEKKINYIIPTNLISPYPMDIAFVQLFASSSAAASYDFDNLMVPFRCVSADIVNKKPYILRKGALEEAIRASMTFPLAFKPIIVDSILMFDGGFYNNFPWDVMEKDFNPDFIIGAKCSTNPTEPDSEDVLAQLENMMMVETNYVIPEEKGILIDGDYTNIALFDFTNIDKIVQMGYDLAIKNMPAIKEKIRERRSAKELSEKRLAFRMKCPQLIFDNINFIPDTLKEGKKEFIVNTLKNHKEEPVNFEVIKRGFNRVVASGNVNTFYPSTRMNSDSLFDLTMRVSERSPLRIAIGGNISSSSLNQGYIGLEYRNFSLYPWKASLDADLGKFYTGGSLTFRQDFSFQPFLFYEADFTAHRFDYFRGSQIEFYPNRLPTSIEESEVFANIKVGSPIDLNRSIMGKVSLSAGRNTYSYYLTDNFTSYDIPDRTGITFVSPSVILERNTTNYKIYPTAGIKQKLTASYALIYSDYKPGSTSEEMSAYTNRVDNRFKIRFYSEVYHNVNKWLTIGSLVDFTLSSRVTLGDYISSLIMMPAFQPTPHSKTLLLRGYRANTYLAAGVNPIIHISNSVFFSALFTYFQPYRTLIRNSDGTAGYSSLFPKGDFMANLAAVWQSPVGPISLSASYYPGADVKWYPQFNIGFLIFRNKSLNN
ncbi:MAG: patatin-like phospholipase family protein [Bacteroidales bacterium]|nr:patatin-like phospholipase family protein [Bacteroidales bacterium]